MIQKTVEWALASKLLIKFVGESSHMKINPDVVLPDSLRKGDVVQIETKEDGGKTVVTKIEKVTAKEKQEEKTVEQPKQEVVKEEPIKVKSEVKETKKVEEKVSKPETPKTEVKKPIVEDKKIIVETRTLTINSLCQVDNKVKLCFKEGNYKDGWKWVFVDEKIGKTPKDVIDLGIVANAKCEITFTNDVATKIDVLDTPKKEESDQKLTKTTSSETNSSIEKQVSLKESGLIINALIAKDSELVNSVEKIKILQIELTKNGLEAMKKA